MSVKKRKKNQLQTIHIYFKKQLVSYLFQKSLSTTASQYYFQLQCKPCPFHPNGCLAIVQFIMTVQLHDIVYPQLASYQTRGSYSYLTIATVMHKLIETNSTFQVKQCSTRKFQFLLLKNFCQSWALGYHSMRILRFS